MLVCPNCGRNYEIKNGIANLEGVKEKVAEEDADEDSLGSVDSQDSDKVKYMPFDSD